MKYFQTHVALFCIALVALLAVASFESGIGRGQSQTERKSSANANSQVKPTVLATDRRNNSKLSLAFAASRNAVLRNELTWIFGGKQQHGWYLYLPLISRLLNSADAPDSKRFAAALARWQEKSGLKPTGILEEESLYAMIAEWQSKRLKDRTPAQPDQLVTAPIFDFYDPERLVELRQVERETYVAYKRMVAAAAADRSLGLKRTTDSGLAPTEKYLKIISSFRSREYQDQLRRQSPNAGSAGLAVNSPHFTGRALDLYVGGEPVDSQDSNRAIQVETRVYQWLVRNADRFGFRPYCYEPWHWEYVR
jgi:zinc D-Ala-D-Ala carboxypeptidase